MDFRLDSRLVGSGRPLDVPPPLRPRQERAIGRPDAHMSERLVLAALATGVAALVIRARRSRRRTAQPTSRTRKKHENIPCPPRAQPVLTKEEAERLGQQACARPISLLVLHNVSKKKNFGELLRSAAAMGVSEVVVVGATKLATHGAQGTAGHLRFSHFSKLACRPC